MQRAIDEDRRNRPGWGTLLFVLACIVVGVWWRMAVWNECRLSGHSGMFCWALAAGR